MSQTLPLARFVKRLSSALLAVVCFFAARPSAAEIRRDPFGVNVNSQAATTVFITFGGLQKQVPVEAAWCGDLVPAAPDLGQKCNPATIFGQLPIRFDQSRLSAAGTVFTDIMSIPPSVARRAYQSAAGGDFPSFFYVRRFRSLVGGPDEYVFVTCRLTAGGARSPLALLDVRLAFAGEPTVQAVRAGDAPPPLAATIAYNGSGRLRGRWEVVMPGDPPPGSRDLLTEASLPPEERALQRRYTEVARFNVFLPPTGSYRLDGPDPKLLPSAVEGMYQVLLRVEASEEREGTVDLAAAGAGTGFVASGAAAGFPLPTLRYYVGSVPASVGFDLVLPADGARLAATDPLDFSWQQHPQAAVYRIDFAAASERVAFSAALQQGIGSYRAPPWLRDRIADGQLRWRVTAVGSAGEDAAVTTWRTATLLGP